MSVPGVPGGRRGGAGGPGGAGSEAMRPDPAAGRAGGPGPRVRDAATRRRAGAVLAALAALALGGCQLSPVYSGGARGIAAATLAEISVAPIPDRAGFLLREELVRRIGEPAPGQARYRLEVVLDDQLTGFGLRGGTAAVSRERRTLRARWRLIDTTTDAVVLDAASGSDAGIDVVASSEFAVVAAEQSALERLAAELADQMTARIALWARQRGPGAER